LLKKAINIISKKKDIISENNNRYRNINKEWIKHNISTNKEEIDKKNYDYYNTNKDVICEKNHLHYLSNSEDLNEKCRRNYKIKTKTKNPLYYYTPRKKPILSWKEKELALKIFDSISEKLHVANLEDWYRVSVEQLKKLGLNGFGKFGSLETALLNAYPNYVWDNSKFSKTGKKSGQRWLLVTLQKLFPLVTILEDYLNPNLCWAKDVDGPQEIHNMQLDIWIPQYNLAFEYQGAHHYFDSYEAFGPVSSASLYFNRDKQKKHLCYEKGITFIEIPYWWDGEEDSLITILNQSYPNLPIMISKKEKHITFIV